jgi:hypothetical protein
MNYMPLVSSSQIHKLQYILCSMFSVPAAFCDPREASVSFVLTGDSALRVQSRVEGTVSWACASEAEVVGASEFCVVFGRSRGRYELNGLAINRGDFFPRGPGLAATKERVGYPCNAEWMFFWRDAWTSA